MPLSCSALPQAPERAAVPAGHDAGCADLPQARPRLPPEAEEGLGHPPHQLPREPPGALPHEAGAGTGLRAEPPLGRAERSITAMGSGPWVSPLTAPHRRQIKSNKDKESKVYYTEQEGEGLSNTATAIIEVRDAKNPSTDDILRTNEGGCTPPGQPSCG